MMDADRPVIETKGLTKMYGLSIGCRDISIKVKPGHIFGLLGPNGAGKSTFVKMIVGLLTATAGEGRILDYSIGNPVSRRPLGYLPELFRYQDWLRAEEVLRFHGFLGGLSRRDLRSSRFTSRIREVLQAVGLEKSGGKRIRQFSKGMQQRLGLACALLLDPPLLILDEPASALDPVGRFEVRSLLQQLKSEGKTIFLNTHLLEDVEAICDEVAFLYQGELREQGRVEQITKSGGRWELQVGGWSPELAESLTPMLPQGFELTVLEEEPDGSARLCAEIEQREQIGLINRLLIEQSVTLYEVRPLRSSLEEWFLAMSGQKKEVPSADLH